MRCFLFCLAVMMSLSPITGAQQNPSEAAGAKPDTSSGSRKEAENLNGLITAARKATSEKRYADSEEMMLRVTRENPALVLPWVELGLAEMGLKKDAEAENAFKMALGIDPESIKRAHKDDFYQDVSGRGAAPSATRASRNTVGGEANNAQSRTPDIKGVSYASLGEVYAHEGKVHEAEEAFDSAVAAFPSQAAQYRRNETIVFFQTGNTDAQLAAAEKAIALDPTRAALYYFKGQALVSKATIDPKTQKMILPPGCAEAYQKYLELDPKGQFSADAAGVLAGAGVPVKTAKK